MIRENLYGSASWATPDDLRAAGLGKRGGLHFGFDPAGASPLWLSGDAPLITCAGSGSGKGLTVIIPALLDWAGPLFVLDPKGENAAVTLHHQAELGKAAWCINPWGVYGEPPWFLPMHQVNPFSILRRDNPYLVAHCTLVMQMIIPEPAHASESYWTLKPRELGSAVLLWQVMKEGSVHAARLHHLLSAIFADPVLWEEIVKDLMAMPDMEVQRVIGEIEEKRKRAGGEFSGIMGTLFNALSFIGDPALSRCLQGGDFTFDVLTGDAPATVYLIVPGDLMKLYPAFIRLMVGVAMLTKGLKPSSKGVVFLLDEAGQLGTFDILQLAFSYKRGGGVRTWAFFQSIGQLIDLYGHAGAQAFLESAQLRQFFGVNHFETARFVSDMLGVATVFHDDPLYQTPHFMQAMQTLIHGDGSAATYHQGLSSLNMARQQSIAQRHLKTPDEVLRLAPDRYLAFISGRVPDPFEGVRKPYLLRPDFAGAYLPNPEHPPSDRVRVAAGGEQALWPVWSHEVFPNLGHLPQYQRGFMSYAAQKQQKPPQTRARRLLEQA